MSHDNNLQRKLIFAIIVAGKSARFAEDAVNRLHYELDVRRVLRATWFQSIVQAELQGVLMDSIRDARTGNYTKIFKALSWLARNPLDLTTCTVGDLERCPGVGPKTSRFFLRWSGRRLRIAVLDVHILRWLAERGYNVPRSTPQVSAEYARVETIFLAEADAMGVHPADLDETIWLERNKSGVRA